MTKYWDARRVRRERERQAKRESARIERSRERARETTQAARRYSPNNTEKNSALMLDALGVPMRRAMVARVRTEGAMSLSKLAQPFRIALPTALEHLRILENANIVTTHKKGRVRICVYNPSAFKELAAHLVAQAAFWESSFERLERHISKRNSAKGGSAMGRKK